MKESNLRFTLPGVNCEAALKGRKQYQQLFLKVLNEINICAYNPEFPTIKLNMYFDYKGKKALTHEVVGYCDTEMRNWHILCWSYSHIREALCQIVCSFCFRDGWTPVHAAGLYVLNKEEGILVVGLPGCGKSTLAALSLIDDRIAFLADEPILVSVRNNLPEMQGIFKGLSITKETCAKYPQISAGCMVMKEESGVLERYKYRIIPEDTQSFCIPLKTILFPSFIYEKKSVDFLDLNGFKVGAALKRQLFPLEIKKAPVQALQDDLFVEKIIELVDSAVLKAYTMIGSDDPAVNMLMLGEIVNG